MKRYIISDKKRIFNDCVNIANNKHVRNIEILSENNTNMCFQLEKTLLHIFNTIVFHTELIMLFLVEFCMNHDICKASTIFLTWASS